MRAEGSGAFPIAVIGAACRFPGASGLAEFWSLLQSGTDAIGPMPEDRWDVAGSFHPDPARPGKMYTREGGFIADIDKFDAGFFGISPREARRIDPQQRILLELTWDAMENAGIVPARLAGSQTGVFVGISFSDYAALQREDPDHVDAYVMSGSAVSNAANRISYIFDLHGPSFAVDTACSSSLVAVHEACVSLWRGESTLAIAGGINALLSPSGFIGFSKAHMLSPTSRCHAFDASGDGYVRSEGGGVVLLKPLVQALADGDPVWAVIAGSGVNSDGRTTGLAMPNPVAQEALLRQVYRDAGIDPASVAYIEAHGTGTSVGDPVECTALGRVFGAARPGGDPCRIGSVKTNVGHLEPASGVAGLMKVLLALRHRELPRSLHISKPNPQIPFAELNLSVVTEQTGLASGPLVMGVNSFGFGGTNAHLILREPELEPVPAAKKATANTTQPDAAPLLLSAANGEALSVLARCYAELLRSPSAAPLPALRCAAATQRTHHAQRLAVFGADSGEVAARLDAFAAGETAPLAVTGQAPTGGSRLAFVFSGNGSQWRGMGRTLFADPLAAEWIERVDAALRPHLGWSVAEILKSNEPEDLYDRTEYAQPALFALQVAVLKWLRAHGVEAEAMLGHSVGEIAAAYAAGILPLADACRVIAVRSQAQQRTAGAGRMAALGLPAAAAAAAIEGYEERLTIAGINSPNSVTIAGDADAIAALGDELKSSGTFYRELALDYAFHSRAMDPVRGELLERLDGLATLPGRYCFISTVTGRELAGNRLGAAYWWDNIRKPVQFEAAIAALTEDGFNTFLEIGPHPILDGYLRECLRASGGSGVALATLRRREPEPEALLTALGRCYGAGVAIDFDKLYPEKTGFVALPAYPWQRERYWFSDGDAEAAPPPPKKHPLLGKRQPTSEAIWKNRLDPVIVPWLADHVVQGSTVVPGTAFIEMALAAAAMETGAEAIEIEGFEIRRPVVIPPGGDAAIEISFSAEDGSLRLLAGETAGGTPPVVVARALPLTVSAGQPAEPLVAIRQRLDRKIDGEDIYRRFDLHGLHYGPAFQGIAEAWAGTGEALGRIEAVKSVTAQLGDYCLHPAILDACLQVTLAAVPEENGEAQAALVPSKADRIRLHGGERQVAWCHMRVTRASGRSIVGSFRLFDTDGAVIAEIDGMRFRRVELAGTAEIPAYHWRYRLLDAMVAGDAADLPGPAGLAAAIDGRDEVRAVFDRLAASYAGAAFADLADADGAYAPPAAKTNGAGPSARTRVIARLLTLVERAGLAKRDGAVWRIEPSQPTPIELWREALRRFPANLPTLQLVARCGEALSAVLRGGGEADDADAAGQGGEVIETLYDSDPLFHGAVEAMAAMLRSASRALPETRLLRVIEIAGGNGGLTGSLLAALPAGRSEYVFSDPDESAVARAEARLAGFDAVSCTVLDPRRGAAEQGLEPASQDIVIPGPALVAASQPRDYLAAAAALLKPGGLLMLPVPQSGGFLDLFAAVVPGLLAASEIDWPAALRGAGFVEVSSAGDGAGSTGAVIVARKSPAPVAAPAEAIDPRTWVVFSGAPIDPAVLTRRLEALGQRVVAVEQADRFERIGLDRFALPRGDRDAYTRLLQLLAADSAEKIHLVYLRGLADIDPGDPLAPAGSYDLLTLVQGTVAAGVAASTELTVSTAGAMASMSRPDDVARPWQAALWGVGRTVMNERADIGCRLIDLDPEAPADAAMAALCDELLHPGEENEILLRGGGRYAPRLARGLPQSDHGAADAESGFTLVFGQGDAADRALLNRIAIPSPGPGEVSVRVHAAGVNFRDVLQRIGLLPEEAFEAGFAGPTMGLEFSGEVVAAGEDVERLRPGDHVFGFGRTSFSSHIVAPAFCLFRKPPSMSFAEAATLPVAAVTVYYSLHHLARLSKGERILIHGAAGGVGLAAVQYAQSVGAEVFASAGTPEKRALLRRLGVQHVVDSRTLAFADDIRSITGGEGIDVVLNSLAGEAIAKGISILRPYGRFVELGKRDFYANSRLGLSPFRHNIQFFGVDVDTLLVDRPALGRTLFEELAPLIDGGVFSPLPHRVYPIARAGEAFRSMQQSRHIGKIVIATQGDNSAAVLAPAQAPLHLLPGATYLVTGGRGGFGLATAEWLASRGARHLALVGRSQTTGADAAAALERLRQDGIEAREFSADVTAEAQLAKVLGQIRRDMPPLRGVIHAAAVIEDVALVNMTETLFHDVLRPKMAGAWNLHRQTLGEKLDFFILYSSAITLFGNEGQANYAAANMYLEALAAHRHGLGLPGLAVAWGAISDVGHMARHAALTERVRERLGVRLLAPARALDRMAEALAAGAVSVALAEVSWSRLGALPAIAKAPKYARMRDLMREDAGEASGGDTEEIRAHLASLPREEAIALVHQLLTKHIAGVVGTAAAKIPIDQPLTDLGMDLLMLVELQIGLDKQFGIAIPTLELMDLATVAKLGRRIVDEVGSAPASEPDSSAGGLNPIADEPKPAFELTLGRLLEQELDRAKERPL